ncbi:MAG TPA: transglutaminase domain-containing protein [Bacteroidales bacterium]|nr:transglutaminase domain-containing protein [Bacteroidales bacterium]
MKKIAFTPIVILLCITLSGQDVTREYGKISQDEISMTKYPRDPEAEAVVLFDMGDTKFIDAPDYEYTVQFTRIRRIKIFNKTGQNYAEVRIPYYVSDKGEAEKVTSIEAHCYNFENGRLNESILDLNTVFDEKVKPRWNQKKFVIPNVKPGSIIEYKYVLESPFKFSLPTWKFQDRIPTVYSRYIVRVIPFWEYAFIVQGVSRFDLQTSVQDPEVRTWGTLSNDGVTDTGYGVRFRDVVNTYVLKDVPAFRDESFITSPEDYMIKLDFQESAFTTPRGVRTEIISTWQKLIDDLLREDDFGKYMRNCDKPAKKILESDLNTEGKSDIDKCRMIINYVKSNFKWNDYYSMSAAESPKELLNQKRGNVADLNLFMTSLLRNAGINATPVILSTRDHGRVRTDYPFLHYFDYVAVMVKLSDQSFLCDASEYFTNYDRIPARCINETGLLIQPGAPSWVNLNLNYKSVDNKAVSMEIVPDSLKIRTKVVLNAVEHDAFWYKEQFDNDTVKLRNHFTNAGLTTIFKLSTLNFDRNDFPYIISVEGEAEIEKLNDKLVISPFLSFYPRENSLKQTTRTYPVDFTYANTESYNCTIKIPDGYKVLTIPESLAIDNPSAKISVKYSVADNIITIESEYGFKKAVYPSSEYSNIRNYYGIVVKKFNEQIVLVKK